MLLHNNTLDFVSFKKQQPAAKGALVMYDKQSINYLIGIPFSLWTTISFVSGGRNNANIIITDCWVRWCWRCDGNYYSFLRCCQKYTRENAICYQGLEREKEGIANILMDCWESTLMFLYNIITMMMYLCYGSLSLIVRHACKFR